MTTVKLNCPYCSFVHETKQTLSILDFGTIKKLQECEQCGGYFMYELELDIKTKIKSIAGEDPTRPRAISAEDMKGHKIHPAPVADPPGPRKDPDAKIPPQYDLSQKPGKLETWPLDDAPEIRPAPVKLKAAQGKLKSRPGRKLVKPKDLTPVDVEAVYLWIKQNNFAYKYERGFIMADIYRYCIFARTAARTKEAMDALEALGKLVKLPETIKSCRGNESGSFGYRLAWEGQKKKKLNFKKPGVSPNYIQSRP